MSDTAAEQRRMKISGTAMFLFAGSNAWNAFEKLAGVADPKTDGGLMLMGFRDIVLVASLLLSLVAITQLLRDRADRTGLTGAVLVLFGAVAGARIGMLGQIRTLLRSGLLGTPPAMPSLDKIPMVFLSVFPPGLMFPIGLMTLGMALVITRPVPRWIGVTLAVGGLFFPIGRALHHDWAYAASDGLLAVAFGALAWAVLHGRRAATDPALVPVEV